MNFNNRDLQALNLDSSLLELLIDEHERHVLPRLNRFWDYYRNHLKFDPYAQGTTRPYRLAQEQGLPARLTQSATPREVVVENDIAWRLHTLADFMFAKPFAMQSTASDPETAARLEAFLKQVLLVNGGIGFFQDLALLGSIYGHVDILVRPSAGHLSADGSMDQLLEAASQIAIEIVEAPRAIPVGKGNRSAQTRRIDQRDLHLLSELDDQPWTLGQALQYVSAIAGLRLDFSRFPDSLEGWTLSAGVSLNRPIGQILRDLLEPWGLMIHREMIWQGRTLIEHRFIQPVTWSRVTEIGPSWPATSMTIDQSPLSGRLWIAQASGWRIEGTFTLRPGWDRSLQGQPAERYSQSDPQFADYANVHRLWVLNEDGRFTGEPYGNAQAFDLTTFFASDQAIEPTPIPFEDGLTLDDSGQRRPALVEVSFDSGVTWSPYAGRVSLRSDRAAICFSDATLPSNVLSAAIANTLAVRVTASLQSPWPVTIQRWQGNPFACTDQPNVLATEAFAFRKVHASSVHFVAVQNGQTLADQADDHQAMYRWLIGQMDRSQAMRPADQAEIRLTLPWVNPLWNVGDRLTGEFLAQRLSELGDQAAEPWTIRHLACRWPNASSSDSGMKITLTPSG